MDKILDNLERQVLELDGIEGTLLYIHTANEEETHLSKETNAALLYWLSVRVHEISDSLSNIIGEIMRKNLDQANELH